MSPLGVALFEALTVLLDEDDLSDLKEACEGDARAE